MRAQNSKWGGTCLRQGVADGYQARQYSRFRWPEIFICHIQRRQLVRPQLLHRDVAECDHRAAAENCCSELLCPFPDDPVVSGINGRQGVADQILASKSRPLAGY